MIQDRTKCEIPLQRIMKTLIASLSLALLTACSQAASVEPTQDANWQSDFSSLLAKYAKPSGVNYNGWAKNSGDLEKLQGVVNAIAGGEPTGSSDDKLAWYLNAYNAWILHLFLEDHPKSNTNALKRNAFFGKDNIVVAGEEMSLNRLEHEIIRPTFKEARVHFALNCAAASCPPLRSEAYTGAQLDQQLQEQADAFINDNPAGVQLDGKTAKVSEIFKWFSEDFDNGDIKGYINKFRDEKLGDKVKIGYLNYDWSRNEAK